MTGADTPESERICWQLTDDPKQKKITPHHFHAGFLETRSRLMRLQIKGAGIFTTVNKTDGAGRLAQNIAAIRAIHVDVDCPAGVTLEGTADGTGLLSFKGPDTPAPPAVPHRSGPADLKLPFRPSIVVATKKGFHLYWLVDPADPVPVALANSLNLRFMALLHGDPNACDVARVLRVPGFFHLKGWGSTPPTDPHLMRLISADGSLLYSRTVLEDAVSHIPVPEKATRRAALTSSLDPQIPIEVDALEERWGVEKACAWLDLREPAVSGSGGNPHTFATCARVQDFVTDRDTGLLALQLWNERNQPPWSSQELAALYDNALHSRQQPPGVEILLERHRVGVAALAAGLPTQGAPLPFVVTPGTPAAPGPAAKAPDSPSPVKKWAPGDWQLLLKMDNGKITSAAVNAGVILRAHEQWQGVLGYNEFTGEVETRKRPPWGDVENPDPGGTWKPQALRNVDLTAMHHWFSNEDIPCSVDVIHSAAKLAARAAPFHPVKEYLSSLSWDGVPRVDSWLMDYLHVRVDDPARPRLEEYARSVGRYWLIAAVARIFEPGCKADCMLILEGVQGRKKSSALAVMAVNKDWFSDDKWDLEDKDSIQAVRGVWIHEMQELDSLTKASADVAKIFISLTGDRARLPYERTMEYWPRQVIFAGTCNRNEYLKDETGGRRYWPVLVQDRVDLVGLRNVRDQLWAEAVHLYRTGHQWWVADEEEPLFQLEQDQRYQQDIWEEEIHAWLERSGRHAVTITAVLRHCLKLESRQQDRGVQMRTATVLKRLGWSQERVELKTAGGGAPRRLRFWAAPGVDCHAPSTTAELLSEPDPELPLH